MKSDWKTEIIRKLPWSATFLVASFCFFKWTNYEIVAWISFIVAIIALFLVIRFEYYEKIIDRQEKQIEHYSKQAIKSQKDATETISGMNTAVATALSQSQYKKIESQTDTE